MEEETPELFRLLLLTEEDFKSEKLPSNHYLRRLREFGNTDWN